MSTKISIGAENDDIEESKTNSSSSYIIVILTFMFSILFLVSILYVGIRSEPIIQKKTVFSPVVQSKIEQFANISFVIDNIPEEIRFLNVSYNLVRSNPNEKATSKVRISGFTEFQDKRSVNIKEFTKEIPSYEETFNEGDCLTTPRLLFMEKVFKFTKVKTQFTCYFSLKEIKGIQFTVTYIEPKGQRDADGISKIIAVLGIAMLLLYVKSIKHSHAMNATNWFFIAFGVILAVSNNPFAIIFKGSEFLPKLNSFFEVSFLSLLRYYIIGLYVSYITKQQKMKTWCEITIIAYALLYGLFEILSYENSENYSLVLLPKKGTELSIVDCITIFFHSTWCLFLPPTIVFAIIRQKKQNPNYALTLSPFALLSVIATFASKLYFDRYEFANDPSLSSIIYTASHAVLGAVILMSQNPNSEVDSKYQEPEQNGYEQVSLD